MKIFLGYKCPATKSPHTTSGQETDLVNSNKNTTAGAATVRSTRIKQNHADTALDMSNRMMSRNVRRVPGQLVMGGIMKINR